MPTAARLATLVRRSTRAARLGFPFVGTTKSPFPRSVRIAGSRRTLSCPADSGYLNDVINVWLDDEYGLSRVGPPPATVVDVGANIGIFSLWARHHFPAAAIHAYEPNPRVLDHARANLAGTGVVIHPEAVGARGARAAMIDTADSRLASTRAAPGGDIPVTSITEVLARIGGTIDLLKMDCEGAEWDILEEGAAFGAVRLIRMEYHLRDGHTLAHLEERAAALGFSFDGLFENQGFGIAWMRRPDR